MRDFMIITNEVRRENIMCVRNASRFTFYFWLMYARNDSRENEVNI